MGFVRRLRKVSLVAAIVTTLIAGAFSAATLSPAEAGTYPSSRWDATTFTHNPGYPTADAPPGRTVVQASMAVVAGATEFTGSVTLADVPDSSVVLEVGPSWLQDGVCEPQGIYEVLVPSTGGPGITWSGSTVSFTLPLPTDPIMGDSTINCAVVAVREDDTEGLLTEIQIFDVASAPLVPTTIYPTPTLTAPSSLKLVRGAPTPIYVTLANPADSPTTLPGNVPVVGSGAGVKVTPGAVGIDLEPGSSIELRLMVTLTSKKAPDQITLTASPPEFTFATTIATKAIKPPTPPKAGRYRGKGISFRVVAKGKKRWVTQIVGRPKDKCLSSPIEPPQRFRVPANNIIDTYSKDEILTTYLVYNRLIMHFTRKRVTGYLGESYYDTSCVMGVDFTAKRVGT